MNMPRLNWFGATLVTRELLSWSKAGKAEDDSDGLLAKLSRVNFPARVYVVGLAINQHGPSLEAAQAIQHIGGFFTDVSAEALAGKLAEAVQRLQSNGIWKFRVAEFGSLDFQGADATESQTDATD